MNTRRLQLAQAPRASGGFSLVELMVGVGISLVILSAVAAVYVNTASVGRANTRVAEIQASGQQAMDALRRDVLNAGFAALTADHDQLNPAGLAVANDCGAGFAMNLRQAVWGANDSNPFSATCIPAANYRANTDVLAIRRLGLGPTGALAPTRLYLRSAFQGGQFFLGSAPPASFTFTPWSDHPVEAIVYFISPFTVSAAENPQVPALYRVRLLPGPTMSAPELVASGIDDLQVQFELRDAADQIRIVDAGAGPLTDSSVNTNATAWESVVAVRVFLLVRSQSGEAGFAPGARTFTLGSRDVTFDDNIPRQVMASVFSLRNR